MTEQVQDLRQNQAENLNWVFCGKHLLGKSKLKHCTLPSYLRSFNGDYILSLNKMLQLALSPGMVQYNCHQCVWINSLLCSQYWSELFKCTLRNQTLLLRPQMFHLKRCRLQLHKLSHVACNWFIVPAPFLHVCLPNYRTVLCRSAELCYCWKYPCNHSLPSPESGLIRRTSFVPAGSVLNPLAWKPVPCLAGFRDVDHKGLWCLAAR